MNEPRKSSHDELTQRLLGEGPRPTRTRALIVVRSAGGGEALQLYRDLPPGTSFTVGRARECEVHCQDSAMSRRHAIFRGADPPTVEDLGSSNGTRVGGEPLAPGRAFPLDDGAIVEMGPVLVVLQRGDGAAELGNSRGVAPQPIRVASPMKDVHRL